MKTYLLTAALLATALIPAHANAQSAESILFSGAVSATSDYRHRGISRSDGGAALRGNLRLDHISGAYGAIGASTVDMAIDPEADFETDFYAGFKGNYQGTIDYDARLTYTTFPGGDNDDAAYWEFALTGGYDFHTFYGALTWAVSPGYINDSGLSLYYAGDVSVPLRFDNGLDLALKGHLGFLFVGDEGPYVDDYVMDWSAGIQYNLPQYDANVSLTYTGTNLNKSDCRERCDSRAVLSATKSFGL